MFIATLPPNKCENRLAEMPPGGAAPSGIEPDPRTPVKAEAPMIA